MTETSAKRFWSKVKKTDTCWEWTGTKTVFGYGVFGHALRREYAHRVSYQMQFGPIPEGLYICHKCDNPKCVNPDHLFAGTHQDNFRDQVSKDRQCYGMKNGMSVLQDDEVRKIRAIYALGGISQSSIRRMFGVTRKCIDRIVKRKGWKLLEDN